MQDFQTDEGDIIDENETDIQNPNENIVEIELEIYDEIIDPNSTTTDEESTEIGDIEISIEESEEPDVADENENIENEVIDDQDAFTGVDYSTQNEALEAE